MNLRFLIKDSYLAFIKNSVGSKSFRNLFFKKNGKKQDILKNGVISCAYFVSTVLLIFGLIEKVHATVSGTIKDLEKSGWRQIKKPRIGSVLIWEKKKIKGAENFHIGFYLGKNKAVSNFHTKRFPIIHHFTFKEGLTSSTKNRKIIAVFWNKNLLR